MVSNLQIRQLFELFSDLLKLHGQDEKLANLLSGAAFRIRNMEEPVLSMDKKQWEDLFRPELRPLLLELKKTGAMEALNELVQLTPSGLFDMMRIKGLGGKKLSLIWKTGHIDNVEDLLKACRANELSKLPGFGATTEKNIIRSIESFNQQQDRFHYGHLADDAHMIVEGLKKKWKTELVSLCGEIRRESLTISSIEIIAAIGKKKLSASAVKPFLILSSSTASLSKGNSFDNIPVTIYHSTKQDFHKELFLRTGNEKHLAKLRGVEKQKSIGSEEDIYRLAGLPFIPPEMREDLAEWNWAKKQEELISPEHIRGVVHNHTTYSDGVDSLEDFATACMKKGFEYCVISDHSKNAHYAGGLKEEKLKKQFAEIDLLNKKLKPFRIFKSIECDILVSGELDYTEQVLRQFDLGIVSIHQLLKMDEQRATKRLIKAIEHPFTTILGHMTGRQLLIRPGYPVNFKKVIDACAANKVVIEINANPYRLDVDWSHVPYALKKGVMISINPDAHSIAEIDNIRWGVSAGRKGGLTRKMTWNAMSLSSLEKWLEKNRKW